MEDNFKDITENLKKLASGDEAAMNALNYFNESQGLAKYVFLKKALPELKAKNIHGKLLGALWNASENDIIVFTKMIVELPAPSCIIAGFLNNIDDELKAILEGLAQEVKKAAIEQGFWREDKSEYLKPPKPEKATVEYPPINLN